METTLTVTQDEVYELEWTVPDVPVVNVFIDPDGAEQSFADPDPVPSGRTPARIEIRSEYGANAGHMHPTPFRKNRTPPSKKEILIDIPVETTLKVFSARFRARWPGVYRFEVKGGPDNATWIQTMTVKRIPKRYNTIADVINDPAAVRRQAILASIYDYMPSFNYGDNPKGQPSGLFVNKTDVGSLDMGKFVHKYYFHGEVVKDASGKIISHPGTSCTTVNPGVMAKPDKKTRALLAQGKAKGYQAANDSKRWAFDAGPSYTKKGKRIPNTENPAWVDASATAMPNVGDTYIVLNGYTMYNGHVGIVVHRPASGNGLWVTADGGQSGPLPKQLAIFVPRWGLMGAHLPDKGVVAGVPTTPGVKFPYPKMKAESNGAVFLSGNYANDTHHKVKSIPVPGLEDDIEGMKKWIAFKQTNKPQATSNPRRLAGFVDVDNLEKLNFEVDGKGRNADHIAKCVALADKIDKVIKATQKRGYIGGKGS